MISIPFFKKHTLLFVGVFMVIDSFSQSLYPPKIQSPNVSSLGAFGEVPINLFTGTPDISIPLHTMSYGKINVPIALRYNSALVKPGQQPGWVGSGWDLESIGTISRQVRGTIDENYINDDLSGNYRAYYPYPAIGNTGINYTTVNFGSYFSNIPNWNTTQQLAYDNFPSDNLGIDVEADEFSFNVLGHTGKFYYEGASGWKVASDENIKVEMTDMFSAIDIAQAINGSTFDPDYSTP